MIQVNGIHDVGSIYEFYFYATPDLIQVKVRSHCWAHKKKTLKSIFLGSPSTVYTQGRVLWSQSETGWINFEISEKNLVDWLGKIEIDQLLSMETLRDLLNIKRYYESLL